MLIKTEGEAFEPTPYNYPKGYFGAQVEFAAKVAELGLAEDFEEALLTHTALHRRMAGHDWQKLMDSLEANSGTYFVTAQIWKAYKELPDSIYGVKPTPVDGRHFGSYIYKHSKDLVTGDQKIELHFNNHGRGKIKSDFSREFIGNRLADLSRLFGAVKGKMITDPGFKPEWVTLGSWMNNFPAIRQSLPPEFVQSGENLYPPRLSFNGDSLWGQFLTNDGGVNQKRFFEFQTKLAEAHDIKSLVESFPVPVVLFRAPIGIFFEQYGIK